MNVGTWISGSSAFSNASMYIWKFSVHVLLKPSLKDFEHYLASMWNELNWLSLNILWHCSSLGLEWKHLFQSCGHCWVFQICWHIESFPSYCFPLFLCIIHIRRLYHSLLFSESLHSVGYFFSFHPWLSLLFSSQLFVSSPQTTTLPSCISFSLGWFWSPLPIQCYKPPSIVLQALYQI